MTDTHTTLSTYHAPPEVTDGRTAAQRLFPAATVERDGWHGIHSHCRPVGSVVLYLDETQARKALKRIDREGCGDGCRRVHEVLQITHDEGRARP